MKVTKARTQAPKGNRLNEMTRSDSAANVAAPKRKYDRDALTYSNSFDHPIKSNVIRLIEWMTAKVTIIRMIRQFEKVGPVEGPVFWATALRVMGVKITTPQDQLDHIPKTGPVVFVANHPHGMVDGMVLGAMIGQIRDDYKILTRSLLTDIDPTAADYLISVPFPHQADAQEKMVEMRTQAMAHLKAGGLVAVFPSGVVASSDTMFGPVIEREWNVFTAKLIRTTGAVVVPCYFPGENSRWYQIANRISATIRQGLLLREIVRSRNARIGPVIAPPVPADVVQEKIVEPRAFMAWLRDMVMGLKTG